MFFSDKQIICLKKDLNSSRRAAYAPDTRKNFKHNGSRICYVVCILD